MQAQVQQVDSSEQIFEQNGLELKTTKHRTRAGYPSKRKKKIPKCEIWGCTMKHT